MHDIQLRDSLQFAAYATVLRHFNTLFTPSGN